MRRFVAVVILTVLVAGCKKRSADKVTYVAADDPKMNAAIVKARDNVNAFIAALRAPKPRACYALDARFLRCFRGATQACEVILGP